MKLHANAALSQNGRRRMVLSVIEGGRSLTEAAEAAGVSDRTCSKWVGRYRAEGEPGLLDRSSAPRHVANRTDDGTVQLLAALRRLRFTAPELAELFDIPVSTVSAVLKRIGMGRLGRLGLEPAQRYERERPGELIHIDVKKLGRIQRGAGKRVTGGHTRGRQRFKDASGIARGMPAGTLFTSPSTKRPVSPTPKCCPTRKRPRPSRSCAARSSSTPAMASPSSASSPTTAPPTAPPPTPSPAASWAFGTSARGPTGPRPTEKQNGSSEPCSAAGPTARSTAQAENAPQPLTAGSGPTTIAADTQPSGDKHPSAA